MSEHFFLSEAIAHFITWACGGEIVRARERRASFRAEHAIRLRGALRRPLRTSRAERATECEELCDEPFGPRERSEQQNVFYKILRVPVRFTTVILNGGRHKKCDY